jgi:hypothetical protein
MRTALALALAVVAGLVPSLALADATIYQHGSAIGGDSFNIYAPSVLYDAQEGKHKMWFGGWRTPGEYPRDRIHYAESVDGIRWTYVAKVLSPDKVVIDGREMWHVNDPSVIKAWNATLGRHMYWMWLTAIDRDPDAAPLNKHFHDIVVASSLDGRTWGGFARVVDGWPSPEEPLPRNINGGRVGVFSPSAISMNDAAGDFWVYYQTAGRARDIVLTKFIGGTRPVSTQRVYSNVIGGAHHPDVARKPDGTYTMLFNKVWANSYAIYKLSSIDGVAWRNETPIHVPACDPHCIAQTPNHRWPTTGRLAIAHYWLYFGLDLRWDTRRSEIHARRLIPLSN